MFHQHPAESERQDSSRPTPSAPKQIPVRQVSASSLYVVLVLAALFAFWYLLFANVRSAGQNTVLADTSGGAPVSLKTESAKRPGMSEKPTKNGEEKAFLLYLLRAFDSRPGAH